MLTLMSMELAEQRRQDLLRQAERARRARKARRARSARAGRDHTPWAWRVATGRALVRVGVLVAGTTLEDSIVVVRRPRRPTTIAVIWSGRRGDHANGPAPLRPRAGRTSPTASRSS
jgi:hypothetical protein